MLTILSLLLMAAGVILFANQWWDTPEMLMKVIGCAIFFSSVVSALADLDMAAQKCTGR